MIKFGVIRCKDTINNPFAGKRIRIACGVIHKNKLYNRKIIRKEHKKMRVSREI